MDGKLYQDAEAPPAPRGPAKGLPAMGRFGVIWSGQLITLIGNSVLRFAFVVQAWAAGQRASQVVLLALCAMLPQVLLSPFAGAVIDRYRRRAALRLANLGGLVTVAGVAIAYATGELGLWQIYLAVALIGATAAFQYPALAAAVPVLVPKEHLQRANGLLGTAKSAADVCGPAIAAALLGVFGLGAIMVFSVASFLLALLTIQVVRVAEEPGRTAGAPRRKLAAESLEGLRYLMARPSLRSLTMVVFVVNLVMVFGFAVVQPMILALSGNDTAVLASVMTSVGVGGITGGLLMGVWGGPKSRIRGMMLGVIGMCLTAQVAMSSVRGVVLWCAATFLGALLMPIVNGTMQAIIQTKVPRDRHGRVFGAVLFVSQISAPLAMVGAGLLADGVFEPQAQARTGLVGLLAPVVGTDRGSGMAAMLLLAGLCGIAVAVWGLVHRPVRDLDVLLPDLDDGDETQVQVAKPGGAA